MADALLAYKERFYDDSTLSPFGDILYGNYGGKTAVLFPNEGGGALYFYRRNPYSISSSPVKLWQRCAVEGIGKDILLRRYYEDIILRFLSGKFGAVDFMFILASPEMDEFEGLMKRTALEIIETGGDPGYRCRATAARVLGLIQSGEFTLERVPAEILCAESPGEFWQNLIGWKGETCAMNIVLDSVSEDREFFEKPSDFRSKFEELKSEIQKTAQRIIDFGGDPDGQNVTLAQTVIDTLPRFETERKKIIEARLAELRASQ
jgi:hypothetical protein